MKTKPKCKAEDCPNQGTPYCSSHRWRLQTHGDVLAHIPLGQLPRPDRPPRAPRAHKPTVLEIAMAPTPEPGRGLLWLV